MRLRYRLVDGLSVETRDITSYDRTLRITVPSGPTVGDITDALLKVTRSAETARKPTTDC